jgi:hypothetical protein
MKDGNGEPTILLPEMQRGDLVHALLAGANFDAAETDRLDYEMDAWHLGITATGTKAIQVARSLKAGLDCELLSIFHGESIWAWLGGAREVQAADLERVLSRSRHPDVSLALGEPGIGIDGWRLTHHQAREARAVAIHLPQRLTWYADCPLLVAAVRDDTLAKSLRQKYIAPLRSQRDGGMELRETLRAYIDAECSATSATAASRVSRHTVESRVQKAELLMGRAIWTCLSELDVALRLEELADHSARRLAARSVR